MRKIEIVLIITVMVFLAIYTLVSDGKGLMRNLDEVFIYYYHEYPCYYEVTDWLHNFAAENPHIAMAESLGYSTRDSLAIWALKISNDPTVNQDKITAMINGSMHAEEIVGTVVCQFVAETLAAGYGIEEEITRYVDNFELWIVPIVNPEGYQVVMEELDYTFRKNKRDNNENGVFDFVFYHGNDTDGVDLNRNFPFNWDGPDAIDEWHSSFYRGPGPASESETQAMIRLCERERFTFSIWYHSSATGLFAETIIYPYKYQDTIICPDQDRNGAIAYRYAMNLMAEDVGAYNAQISQRMHGNAPDWEYYRFATVSFMTEIGTETQPPFEVAEFQMRNHFYGLEYLFRRTLDEEILRVHVTDYETGEPIEARVEIEGRHREGLTGQRYTDPIHGAHYRLMLAGNYTVWVSAEGYDEQYIDITIERGTPYDLAVELRTDAVAEDNLINNPKILTIEAIKPNPFNCSAEIKFNNEISTDEVIMVFNTSGTLVDRIRGNGTKSIRWIPDEHTASGLYLFTAGDNVTLPSKAVLVK